MSSSLANGWRPGDLEAIRIALGINATRPAVEAINKAMLQLEQGYADAIPTARILLDQIGVLDARLLQLSPADHQGWSEQQRKGPLPGSSAAEALQRQRLNLSNQVLLILPALQSWSSQGQSALPPFTAALLKG